MKTPADMLASDLRRMAGAIPVGWRAVVVMAMLIAVFPLLIGILILDALTYEMPAVRHPFKMAARWMGALMHQAPRRVGGLPPPPQVRPAH
jgi:hypothetical protein